jgi:hypothetical protein
MVASSTLSRCDEKKHEDRKAENVLVEEEFICCEENGICPVPAGLRNMMKRSTIRINA